LNSSHVIPILYTKTLLHIFLLHAATSRGWSMLLYIGQLFYKVPQRQYHLLLHSSIAFLLVNVLILLSGLGNIILLGK